MRKAALLSASLLVLSGPALAAKRRTPRLEAWTGWLDAAQAVCVEQARRAISSRKLRVTEAREWYVIGKSARLHVAVYCAADSKDGGLADPGAKRVLAHVTVAGSRGTARETSAMRDYLRDFLRGSPAREEGPVNQPLRAGWKLGGGSPRVARYPFRLEAPMGAVRIRVRGGEDDSGDGRVEVLLHDPRGSLVLSKKSDSLDSEWDEWRVDAESYGLYELVLRDLDTKDKGAYPGNGGRIEVLFETRSEEASEPIEAEWRLASMGTPREARYPFRVTGAVRAIKVRVQGGEDDSGDRKVEVVLNGPDGAPVLREKSGSSDSGWDEWRLETASFGAYELILRDMDTRDGGTYPGNAGKVEVLFESEKAEVNEPIKAYWWLATKGAPREARYPFEAAAPVRTVVLRVQGGEDDSGDRSVEVLLYDPTDVLVFSRSSKSSDYGWDEWSVPVGTYGRYELVLRDMDTLDTGEYPGNGGRLEILFK